MLYKVSGVSAIILVVSYIIIVVLYTVAGVPPRGGQEWLEYLTGHRTEWCLILGLSVLTDLLFIPIAYALYVALKDINRDAVLAGTSLLILFVVLDLAVTWT